MAYDLVRDKYNMHRWNAKERGIPFLLTFEGWLKIWTGSGHLHERGPYKGQYVMARYGDKGPYAVGNVKIITTEENSREKRLSPETRELVGSYHRGKLVSTVTRERLRRANTGRRPSLETRAKMSESHKRG